MGLEEVSRPKDQAVDKALTSFRSANLRCVRFILDHPEVRSTNLERDPSYKEMLQTSEELGNELEHERKVVASEPSTQEYTTFL